MARRCSTLWHGCVLQQALAGCNVLHHCLSCATVNVDMGAPCLRPVDETTFAHLQVQKGAIVAAGALVTPGTTVPSGLASLLCSSMTDNMLPAQSHTALCHAHMQCRCGVSSASQSTLPLSLTSTLPDTGEIWAGRPAKLLRKLEEGEAAFITRSAANYAMLSGDHAIENAKTFPEVDFSSLQAAQLRH